MNAAAPPSADHAIVVGIERYLDEKMTRLRGARSDAVSFYEWVTSPAGGGVPTENVTLLATCEDGPGPRIEDIEAAFVRLCGPAGGGAVRGRRLYIYLSGHGIAQEVHETSLVAADGGPGAPERHVPGWHWLNWFLVAGCFSEVVLFADCCRTVHGAWSVRPFPLSPVRRGTPRRVRWVRGYAVQYGGIAFEVQNGSGGKGIFTSALVEALRWARKENGHVTAASIGEYLHNHPDLQRWRARQEPSIVFDGDLVFSQQPPDRTQVLISSPAGAAPRVEGGPGQRAWPVRGGGSPGEFVADLPRGLYEAGAASLEPRYFKVNGTPRETVRVSLG